MKVQFANSSKLSKHSLASQAPRRLIVSDSQAPTKDRNSGTIFDTKRPWRRNPLFFGRYISEKLCWITVGPRLLRHEQHSTCYPRWHCTSYCWRLRRNFQPNQTHHGRIVQDILHRRSPVDWRSSQKRLVGLGRNNSHL